MILHGIMLSPFVARVAMLCRYKQVEFTANRILGPALKEADYLALNPMGKVPALEDGDVKLPESGVICEYIESKHPSNPMIPSDLGEAARVRAFASISDQYVLAPVLSLNGQMSRRTRDQSVVDAQLPKIEKGLSVLEQLIDASPYACGDKPTLADCYLMPTLFFVNHIMRVFYEDAPLSNYPKLTAYWAFAQAEEQGERALGEMKDEIAAFVERMKAAAAANKTN